MRIIDLSAEASALVRQTAQLLVDGFQEMAPDSWPTLDRALETVHESLGVDRISRIALDDQGEVVGWIGGLPEYDGLVWELHPLVVRPDQQRQGIGRALVADLEVQVAARGGLTITLGTDDEMGMTSLFGIDLYADLPGAIATIRNLGNHPYEFYQKLGYIIVGVIPDANGLGKPDILMAKRVSNAYHPQSG
ncbi:MAG: GNAT family N-acetyltransferase [Aggregatilineales bacterium]